MLVFPPPLLDCHSTTTGHSQKIFRCGSSRTFLPRALFNALFHFLSSDVSKVFKSVHHPEDTPRGVVFTRALARPLGVCTVPIMIGATASALQGQPVWSYLVWGLPAALLVATFWAQFTLRRRVAEVHLRPAQAVVRSVRDVLNDHSPDWQPLYNVRTTPWRVEVSVGWNTYELDPPHWPEYDTLQEEVQNAFHPDESSSVRPPSYA